MKLALSNLAWPVEQDADVAATLMSHGVRAIEIAPTKIWPSPLEATPSEANAYRRRWEDRGIRIVAAQALLFGQPDLVIFRDAGTRRRTLAYLDSIVRLCADLGAEALVFGSPKNRLVGSLDANEIERIAVEFFGALGDIAVRHGTTVVIEANAVEYGADFVTHASDAVALVRQVDRPGFRLHLDTACMTLADDPLDEVLSAGREYLHHFHVSEPFLAPIGTGKVDHARFAQALRACGYDRWCSIEMKMAEPFQLANLERAVEVTNAHYAAPGSES